ncbi:MAG: zinc ribbon domain-containing protein [Spirochaetota bacterium]
MKKARYYCENCHREVPLEADTCPYCGKRFSSVRCSKCGFAGDPALFKTGCPVCGYMSPAVSSLPGKQTAQRNTTRRAMSQLPRWAYTLFGILFIIAIVLMIIILLRR